MKVYRYPIASFGPVAAVLLWLFGCVASEAMIDRDGDGMSDVWEARFNAQSLAPDDDDDGDGNSNLVESIDGTDPFDPDSFLGIAAVTHHPSAVVFRWVSVAGIRYRIERSSTLDPGDWQTEGFAEGQAGRTDYAVPASADSRSFFRVVVDTEFTSLDDTLIGPFYSQDTDQDGVSDIDEWISGTNPIDRESRLTVESIAFASARTIEWNTEKGKRYQLQERTSGSEWSNLALVGEATGHPVAISHAVPDLSDDTEYRVIASNVDTDGDGVDNWEEHLAGFDPEFPDTLRHGNGDRVDLEILLDGTSHLAVEASTAVANITRMENGEFVIHRSGGLAALEIHYNLDGTAAPDADYVTPATHAESGNPMSGTVTLPFGHKSVTLPVIPLAGSALTLSESVVLTLSAHSTYSLAEESGQQVNIVREVPLNVSDYGTVGDGVTDDTPALQAAIDALLSSTEHNTLFFPTGNYRLNTAVTTVHSLNTSNHRILQMAALGQEGRDLFLVGETGATLYSTVSPLRAKMLLILANFRSMEFRGLRWEKDSAPLSAKNYTEPNGASAIAIQQMTDNEIESVRFLHCEFFNCHRAITFAIASMDLNGRLRNVTIRGCHVDNPYGSNTINGATALGGGTQVFLSPWIAYANYEDNYFSGGADNLADAPFSPGGIYKDGAHFGSPLHFRFVGNIVKNMGVESVFQTNENTRLGISLVPFVMPEPDSEQTAEVAVNFEVGDHLIGQVVNSRASAKNNLLRIVGVDQEDHLLIVENLGHPQSIASGATMQPAPLYLQIVDPTTAEIFDNWFIRSEAGAIVTVARSTIRNNVITDSVFGILLSEDVSTPETPATTESVVRSNLILTRDSRTDLRQTFGIYSWAPAAVISNNLVLTPFSQRFAGVHTEGKDALIRNNAVLSAQVAHAGYAHLLRGTGVALGNRSGGVTFDSNITHGFDVGVGPIQAFQEIFHYVCNHMSLADFLPIDPVGLLTK